MPALFHALGELAVPALDLRRHRVEGARQIAELVAAIDGDDAMAQLAPGQGGGAAVQCADRTHDGPARDQRQHHSRRERNGDRRRRPPRQQARLGQGVLGRLVHRHHPTQVGHLGGCAQALDAVRAGER
jgi:hypothetical protein